MFGSLETDVFQTFGPCAQSRQGEPPTWRLKLPRTRADIRRKIREQCPARPGVYGIIDGDDQLIYVGKSKSLRSRLASYFQKQPAHAKAKQIAKCAAQVVWEPGPHEFGALLRELELIRRWRPRFNVRGRPERVRHAYLCLSNGAAPFFRLVANPPAAAKRVFGPLPRVRRAKEATLQLNYYFKLRDCPLRTTMHFANQGELFPEEREAKCMRFDFESCLGPCAAGCGVKEYQRQVTAATAFLSGMDGSALNRLSQLMQTASQDHHYERAAVYRDRLDSLSWLQYRLTLVDDIRRRCSFVYPLRGYNGKRCWYLVRQGELKEVVDCSKTATSARRRLKALDRHFPQHEPVEATRGFSADLEMGKIIRTWLQQEPDQLAETLTPDQARAICEQTLQGKAAAASAS